MSFTMKKKPEPPRNPKINKSVECNYYATKSSDILAVCDELMNEGVDLTKAKIHGSVHYIGDRFSPAEFAEKKKKYLERLKAYEKWEKENEEDIKKIKEERRLKSIEKKKAQLEKTKEEYDRLAESMEKVKKDLEKLSTRTA